MAVVYEKIIPIGSVDTSTSQHPNAISNVRYTWYNFLPLQLLHALQKPSNLFFLFISLLQQIPNASPPENMQLLFR